MLGPSRIASTWLPLAVLSVLVGILVLLVTHPLFPTPKAYASIAPVAEPTTAWVREPNPSTLPRRPSSRPIVFGIDPDVPLSGLKLPAIAQNIPLADLMPRPPKVTRAPIYLGDDLAKVPELRLEALPEVEVAGTGTLSSQEWRTRLARAAAGMLHLDDKEEDGFVKALARSRPDLAGLPFLLGEDCVQEGPRAEAFAKIARRMRLGPTLHYLDSLASTLDAETLQVYKEAHAAVAAQVLPEVKPALEELIYVARANQQPDAMRELVRVAVFSQDRDARAAALEALVRCDLREGGDVLMVGMRYPWPAVVRNAAHAAVVLHRTDLVPEMQALLAEPDPRAPVVTKIEDKQVPVAREVVRINHHRNCLLCHAPAAEGKVPAEALLAPIPLPSEPAPLTRYYGLRESIGNLLVRIDMTYLRQDFSAIQPVYDSSEWRVMQRFDYVVRKRELTPAEAQDLRNRLKDAPAYRQIIGDALRCLTGKDS